MIQSASKFLFEILLVFWRNLATCCLTIDGSATLKVEALADGIFLMCPYKQEPVIKAPRWLSITLTLYGLEELLKPFQLGRTDTKLREDPQRMSQNSSNC